MVIAPHSRACQGLPTGVQLLLQNEEVKLDFYLTFRLPASSEGKEALFPLTKPEGETLGKKRFSVTKN